MKSFIKLSALSLALCSTTIHAVHPINGAYAGLILGGSYSPNTQVNLKFPSAAATGRCDPTISRTCSNNTLGKLVYSGFGNIGGQVGIRRDHLRLELEPFINYLPYQKVTVGNLTFTSPKSFQGMRIKGDTATAAIMFNGIYDFYSTDDGCNFAPYVGAGVGYAFTQNKNRFYCDNQTISCTASSDTDNGFAVQGIVGASYFMDDFTWFGLDFRYIAAQKVKMLDSRIQIYTVNLSFNGMFYCD